MSALSEQARTLAVEAGTSTAASDVSDLAQAVLALVDQVEAMEESIDRLSYEKADREIT
jgi:hypothetical protein